MTAELPRSSDGEGRRNATIRDTEARSYINCARILRASASPWLIRCSRHALPCSQPDATSHSPSPASTSRLDVENSSVSMPSRWSIET